jgi:hypothetical protein
MNPGSIQPFFYVFPKKMRGKWRFCVASRRDSQRLLGSCEQSSVLGQLIGGFLRQKNEHQMTERKVTESPKLTQNIALLSLAIENS